VGGIPGANIKEFPLEIVSGPEVALFHGGGVGERKIIRGRHGEAMSRREEKKRDEGIDEINSY
jgi:hypothetical protein